MRKKVYALKNKVFNPSFNNNIKFELNLSNHNESISSFEVMNLKFHFDEKVFFKEFDDFEIKMGVHRFVWLYDLLINEVSLENLTEIKNLLFKWIQNFDRLDNEVTKESYSIGERISSWLFFYAFSNQYLNYSREEKNILVCSIKQQLDVLADNIEYQGKFTNNHILNNGKVFYLAGEFLNIQEWKILGIDILKSEFNNFFLNGFFIENSSHYQMIYAKNFMEMSMVCEFGDNLELKKWFEDKTNSILVHCRNLQSISNSFNTMPFFGDISPDINPNWFLGYPFSTIKNRKSKWYQLFKYEPKGFVNRNELNKNILLTKNYIKIKHLDFEIWIWLKELGLGAHGHQDNGNCVIYNNGNPLIIDSGRYKYTKDKISQNQTCTKGHFLPFSNVEEWDFLPSSPLSNNLYFKSNVKIELIDDNKLVFLITSWNSKMQIRRTFLLSKKELVVSDECIKGRKFSINLIFPFEKEFFNIKDDVFLIGNVNLQIESESLIDGIKILDEDYSPSYGSLRRGSKIAVKLEKKIKYIFKINENYLK
mgnify:CR=1 FL=1